MTEPDTNAASEREKIAQYLEHESKEYEAHGMPVTSMELWRAAREIRDGAHHEGRE